MRVWEGDLRVITLGFAFIVRENAEWREHEELTENVRLHSLVRATMP